MGQDGVVDVGVVLVTEASKGRGGSDRTPRLVVGQRGKEERSWQKGTSSLGPQP